MSRIDFRDDQHISTSGYACRRGRSFDRSGLWPVATEFNRLNSEHAECGTTSSTTIQAVIHIMLTNTLWI